MGLLISIYWLSKEEEFLQRIPVAIAVVMIPLCMITIADFLLNLGIPSFDGYNRLYTTGFSTSRTQWSGGLVSLGIFMVWCFIMIKKKPSLPFSGCLCDDYFIADFQWWQRWNSGRIAGGVCLVGLLQKVWRYGDRHSQCRLVRDSF